MEVRPSSAIRSSSIGGEITTSANLPGRSPIATTSSLNRASERLRNSEAACRDDGRWKPRGFPTRLSVGKKWRRVEKLVAAPRCDGGGKLPARPGSPISNMGSSPPGLGQFKPPPTAWVPVLRENEEEKNRAAERAPVLVEKLKNGVGTWQERAAFVKELQQIGVTSEDLYSMTFVPIVKQLEIVVAAQVYQSLVQAGTSTEILEQLDESSMGLLYAIRTLSAAQRRAAMEYIIENSFTVEEAEKLASAIKDHMRRATGRKGFSTAPGDCLAFMYHRQAFESDDLELRESFIELGLKAAATESARERFSEFS